MGKSEQNYRRTIKGRWKRTRWRAERRGHEFALTLEQFIALVGPNRCHYCAGPLPVAGTALDRVDNTKGYTFDNVLPCCTECNQIKSSVLDRDEMEIVGAVRRVLRKRKKLC